MPERAGQGLGRSRAGAGVKQGKDRRGQDRGMTGARRVGKGN